jgi:cell wall-associated NlpC family hydrolase
MTINGKALTAVAVGSVFVWSGIKGWSLLGTLSDIVLGKVPSQASSQPLTVPGSENTSGGGGLGGSATAVAGNIAATALQYQGHAYSFGGAPGRDGESPWDCSSFCNYVIGIKLGLAIPGYGAGSYNGSSHGPPTGAWGVWNGLTRISRGEVQAGDLIVWLNHMGIAIGNDQMISALNESIGTKVTPIDGYGNGPLLAYGRYGRVVHGGIKPN